MRISDIHSGKFSHSPEKGGWRPAVAGGWIQARNQETMALGLVEMGHKWDILSIIAVREAGAEPLLLSPSLTLLVHPRQSRWGQGIMYLQTMRRDLSLADENLGSLREPGWGGGRNGQGL